MEQVTDLAHWLLGLDGYLNSTRGEQGAVGGGRGLTG
jgi:hypothetical protein